MWHYQLDPVSGWENFYFPEMINHEMNPIYNFLVREIRPWDTGQNGVEWEMNTLPTSHDQAKIKIFKMFRIEKKVKCWHKHILQVTKLFTQPTTFPKYQSNWPVPQSHFWGDGRTLGAGAAAVDRNGNAAYVLQVKVLADNLSWISGPHGVGENWLPQTALWLHMGPMTQHRHTHPPIQ